MISSLLTKNSAENYGDLPDTNQGLTIQIIKKLPKGKHSSIAQTSIINKQNPICFRSLNQQRNFLQYKHDQIHKIQKQAEKINHQRKFSKRIYGCTIQNIRPITRIGQSNIQKIVGKKYPNFGQTQLYEESPKIQVIKKSNYDSILAQCQKNNKLFNDPQFTPTDEKLGSAKYIKNQQLYGGWKRVSQIVKNPIFVDNFDAEDTYQGNIQDCYLLSSIGCLAKQYPQMFEKIFAQNRVNEYGVYMARLYSQGVLVQIVVDDYVPIKKLKQNQAVAQALYAKPSKTNQIWIMILQKCWAKLFHSYERIQRGSTPPQVFYALTGTPYGIKIVKDLHPIPFYEDNDKKVIQEIQNKLKKQQFIKLYKYKTKGGLFGCNTLTIWDTNQKIKFQKLGLAPLHAYSIIDIIVQPICIVKLRNPWGNNIIKIKQKVKQVQTIIETTVAYQYNWKDQLTKKYGPQEALKIISQLKQRGVNLQDPQKDGLFYMSYEQFFKHFQTITVCEVKDSFNLLSYRSIFQRRIPNFYQFKLTKRSPIIVSLSQKFKGLQQKVDSTQPYMVTTLVLAKKVKRKNINQRIRQDSNQLNRIQSSTSLKLILTENSKIEEKKLINTADSLPYNEEDLQIDYQIVASRSNNTLSPFNFVTRFYSTQNQSLNQLDKNQSIGTLQQGQYVIYASVNLQARVPNGLFTITVYSQDASFPQQIKKQNLSLKLFQNQTSQPQRKWLERVFLDKLLKQRKKLRPLTQFPNQGQMPQPINQLLDLFINAQRPLTQSWFAFYTPTKEYYQKYGCFGYFACHLSQDHPNEQIFQWDRTLYQSRSIFFYEESSKKNGNMVTLNVKPGQIKIMIMKFYHLRMSEQLYLQGVYRQKYGLKYDYIGKYNQKIKVLPKRISKKIQITQQIKKSESTFDAISIISTILNLNSKSSLSEK